MIDPTQEQVLSSSSKVHSPKIPRRKYYIHRNLYFTNIICMIFYVAEVNKNIILKITGKEITVKLTTEYHV